MEVSLCILSVDMHASHNPMHVSSTLVIIFTWTVHIPAGALYETQSLVKDFEGHPQENITIMKQKIKKGAASSAMCICWQVFRKKKKKGLETPEAPCMLHISRFTIHHISFPLFFLFDEQVFLLTEGAAGLHNNLLPLDQLENYSAHEILYTSASSIPVKKKKKYFAAPANLPQLWRWSYLFPGVNSHIITSCQ